MFESLCLRPNVKQIDERWKRPDYTCTPYRRQSIGTGPYLVTRPPAPSISASCRTRSSISAARRKGWIAERKHAVELASRSI